MSEEKPRLLVVDDEPAILDTICRAARILFPNATSGIDRAGSVADALALLRRSEGPPSPLVVVSDFNMGSQLDGLHLLEEVARLRPDAHLVLMSGYPRKDFEGRSEIGRVHAFLPKPFELQELRAVLATKLRPA